MADGQHGASTSSPGRASGISVVTRVYRPNSLLTLIFPFSKSEPLVPVRGDFHAVAVAVFLRKVEKGARKTLCLRSGQGERFALQAAAIFDRVKTKRVEPVQDVAQIG